MRTESLSDSVSASLKALGRATVAVTLCVLLVEQPLLAESAVRKTPKPATAEAMPQQDRVLHALNRLTFGPRPGDVAAVSAIGLNKWFEQQLNPSSIPDAALDARLTEYPAMQLSLEDLQRRYPGPQTLKAIDAGRLQLPADPTERAMVQDQLAFYNIARKAQTTQLKQTQPAMDAGAADPSMDSSMTPAVAPATGKGKRRQAMQAAAAAADTTNADTKQLPAAAVAPDQGNIAALAAAGTLTRPQAEAIAALEPEARLKAIMALPPADLIRLRAVLGPRESLGLTQGLNPQQKEMLVALPGSLRMVALESMESRLLRDVYSDRQLEAVMTDFWLNHFNVYVRKNQQEPYLLPSYERETIRPHALGNFEDLLVATAKSPAMLVYLDNFRSTGPDSPQAARIKQAQARNPNGKLLQQASAGLNENYGRELMELHTLGVNGGYTQADVTNVAKVFTGWGLDRPYQGGGYQFEERKHEPGSKVVLGRTINEAGEKEGLEVLHMLATSPATAHFISEKLAVRFVADNPPPALVDHMAASFLKSNGDIKTVLRTMFNSPEFWAKDVYHAKVKTPIEFVASAARASNLQIQNPAALVQALDKLGMPLYGMQTPNGYSWKQDEWVSTGALVARMNFSLVLASDRIPGTRTEWLPLLDGTAKPAIVPAAYSPDTTSPAPTQATIAKERRLEMVLLGQPVSERTRATVLGQSSDAATVTEQAATQFDLGANGKRNYMPRGARGAGNPQAASDDPQAAVMAGLLLGSPEFQRR